MQLSTGRKEHPSEEGRKARGVETDNADPMDRWRALLEYDAEIRAAAEELRPYGQAWVDKLGHEFIALDQDRKYLPNIVATLIEQAREARWERFRYTSDGEICTDRSLAVLRDAEEHGFALDLERNGTFSLKKGTATTFLHSNAEIDRFVGILSRSSHREGASPQNEDVASSDLALVLIGEFSAWFETFGVEGILPRAFTGVTSDGKQAVIILTGLPLDHIQRREFLIWLCRTEGFVAYAYGTQVGIADDTSSFTEGLDIYASSYHYDASRTLGIERQTGGKIRLSEQHRALLPAKPENGLFFGLQRSNKSIPANNERVFQDLWRDLKSKAMWRQR